LVPPAPLDPTEVALALARFGSSRMLPRAAYLDDEVLAWEMDHFVGGWMCPGTLRGHRDGRMHAQSVREYGVLLARDSEGLLAAVVDAEGLGDLEEAISASRSRPWVRRSSWCTFGRRA